MNTKRVYKVIPVVACVIQVGRQCLLTKKISKHKDTNGKWEFPGGKVEKGETLEQAVIREIKEELSIDIYSPILIHTQMNYYSFSGSMVAYFVLSLTTTSLQHKLMQSLLSKEHTWATEFTLPENCLPGTKEALSHLLT